MLFNADVVVRVVNFPNWGSRFVVKPNDDGTYSLYANARYTNEQLLKRLPHEVVHMEKGHHWDDRPVEELEAEADGWTKSGSEH